MNYRKFTTIFFSVCPFVFLSRLFPVGEEALSLVFFAPPGVIGGGRLSRVASQTARIYNFDGGNDESLALAAEIFDISITLLPYRTESRLVSSRYLIISHYVL